MSKTRHLILNSHRYFLVVKCEGNYIFCKNFENWSADKFLQILNEDVALEREIIHNLCIHMIFTNFYLS